MQIDRVRIQNFRCFSDVEIAFDDLTTFIGPNGAGKSTVLRALDWVFNQGKDSLSPEDLHSGCVQSEPIVVTVYFNNLDQRDRQILTDRYAPSESTEFALRREWSDSGDRLMGATQVFPGFTEVRSLFDGPAGPFNKKYDELRKSKFPELPAASSKQARSDALLSWEQEHRELLSPEFITDTNMFGFAGSGLIARAFQYVFVDADFRGAEEATDNGKSIVGRLLLRLLDRSNVDTAITALLDETSSNFNSITETHLSDSLHSIANKLNDSLNKFTTTRTFSLRPREIELTPQSVKIDVRIADGPTETSITRQGHGFQRAAIIASLQVLSEADETSEEAPSLFLAIEEPELFQHPTQARTFAKVLRRLAASSDRSTQVAFATHSPFFIEPFEFHKIRRVIKNNASSAQVYRASRTSIDSKVDKYYKKSIDSMWSRVILDNLAEAFFSAATVLVEGTTDKSMLLTASEHLDDFDLHGITVCSMQGKTQLILGHAVLEELGIPALVVFDNDSAIEQQTIEEMRGKIRDAGENRELTGDELNCASKKATEAEGRNRALANYLSADNSAAFPIGRLTPHLYAVDVDLEYSVAMAWPEFAEQRELAALRLGVKSQKHQDVYRLAGSSCRSKPSGQVAEIIDQALLLAGANTQAVDERELGEPEL